MFFSLLLGSENTGAELELGPLAPSLHPPAVSEAPLSGSDLALDRDRLRRVVVSKPHNPAARFSSQGYQNNNNNMDGLSSDFTSASPYMTRA